MGGIPAVLHAWPIQNFVGCMISERMNKILAST